MQSGRMWLSLRSYREGEDAHCHGFHQAVLPVDGVMDLRVGDAGGSIADRRGVMIMRGARHVFRTRGANRFIVLDMLPGEALPAVQRSPFFDLDETLVELTRYASGELVSGGLGAGEKFHLAALIAGKIRRCLAVPGGLAAPERVSGPIDRAIGVMRARHAERLTMAEVAGAAGLGVSRFHDVYRRETGRTPAEMLADIRLDCAEDLLERTRLPIAEIALLVGFSEQSALTRSLRRRRGTTPRALRRGGV